MRFLREEAMRSNLVGRSFYIGHVGPFVITEADPEVLRDAYPKPHRPRNLLEAVVLAVFTGDPVVIPHEKPWQSSD
jgi:hypothetical protein